jgi:BolA protein
MTLSKTQPQGAGLPAPRVEQIRALLKERLTPIELTIRDDSAQHAGHAGAREGGHFAVHIVSGHFQGRSRIQRHQMVYAAVADLMGRGIHALAIAAQTPRETAS